MTPAAPRTPAPSSTGPRVLVVEDDVDILDTLREALADELAVSADVARAPQEALRLLRQQPYDVLLTDERLPGMSGSDLIRTVQRDPAPPACILISAFHETAAGLRLAESIGAAQFLRKPLSLDDLRTAVVRALEVRA